MRRPPDTDQQDDVAWQRLLSLKESYAVQLQEKQTEMARLQRTLEDCAQTTEQVTKVTAERDAALNRARMSEAMERQHAKRIERLEQRIRRLQQDMTDVHQRLDDQGRDDGAVIDQLRKQLAQRDEMMGVIERESSQVQQDHRQTIDTYETTLATLQAQHVVLEEQQQARIAQLEQTLCQLTDRLSRQPLDVNVAAQRLEAQLEISTLEIDRDRQKIQAQALTIERLQQELQRLHARAAEADVQLGVLRHELQTELDDKRRVMNDANAALEAQIRCEEEIDRLRLSLDARSAVSLPSCESATQVRLLQREVVDLESRLQHKVLRVPELEEAVRVERQKVALLEARLERSQGNKVEMPVSPVSPHRPSVSSTNEYCEICEEYGHEVMTCKALSMMEYLDKSSVNCYCVNCDQFDTHPTEECPNRDEMF
ncbi:MAG: hypothetical protein EXX96DRAFT_486417 [Benjaminiella poitrasii]|nr:MAG: hypothetical protein EXX96DRAFT_486417 [Benjaminiella poitrasii]